MLQIESDQADQLARQLAALTGESVTEAVVRSIEERLDRHHAAPARLKAGTELVKMADRLQNAPILDPRSPEEILGYDENGLPT